MVGESNQKVFLIQIDALRFADLGDNRIVFEDLPTYIGGLYVANLVWHAKR